MTSIIDRLISLCRPIVLALYPALYPASVPEHRGREVMTLGQTQKNNEMGRLIEGEGKNSSTVIKTQDMIDCRS